MDPKYIDSLYDLISKTKSNDPTNIYIHRVKRSTREEKMKYLKKCGYKIVDNTVICGKIVSKNYKTIFDIMTLDHIGLYTDEILLKYYEEDHKNNIREFGGATQLQLYLSTEDHTPGLWATTTEKSLELYNLNYTKKGGRRCIEVCYHIDDIICTDGGVKSWQYTVTDLNPKWFTDYLTNC